MKRWKLTSRACGFEGLACLASCDRIVLGMLVAAARFDLLAVLVTGGLMAEEECLERQRWRKKRNEQ